MNSFEEKFTAWIDGALDEKSRLAFEREIAAQPGIWAERERIARLAGALRAGPGAPPMPHTDFFNSRLLDRIRHDDPARDTRPAAAGWLGILTGLRTGVRMALSGAACLLVAAILFVAVIPKGVPEPSGGTKILLATTSEKAIFASPVISRDSQYAVLWIDGLDFVPAEHRIQ